MGLHVKNEVPLPVTYRGQVVCDNGLRLDLVVEDAIVVELKSVEQIQPVHLKQVLTYVRLAKKSLRLLINLNELHLKDGIHRIVNSSRSD